MSVSVLQATEMSVTRVTKGVISSYQNVTYTVTSSPQYGRIVVTQADGSAAPVTAFTQEDVDAQLVAYESTVEITASPSTTGYVDDVVGLSAEDTSSPGSPAAQVSMVVRITNTDIETEWSSGDTESECLSGTCMSRIPMPGIAASELGVTTETVTLGRRLLVAMPAGAQPCNTTRCGELTGALRACVGVFGANSLSVDYYYGGEYGNQTSIIVRHPLSILEGVQDAGVNISSGMYDVSCVCSNLGPSGGYLYQDGACAGTTVVLGADSAPESTSLAAATGGDWLWVIIAAVVSAVGLAIYAKRRKTRIDSARKRAVSEVGMGLSEMTPMLFSSGGVVASKDVDNPLYTGEGEEKAVSPLMGLQECPRLQRSETGSYINPMLNNMEPEGVTLELETIDEDLIMGRFERSETGSYFNPICMDDLVCEGVSYAGMDEAELDGTVSAGIGGDAKGVAASSAALASLSATLSSLTGTLGVMTENESAIKEAKVSAIYAMDALEAAAMSGDLEQILEAALRMDGLCVSLSSASRSAKLQRYRQVFEQFIGDLKEGVASTVRHAQEVAVTTRVSRGESVDECRERVVSRFKEMRRSAPPVSSTTMFEIEMADRIANLRSFRRDSLGSGVAARFRAKRRWAMIRAAIRITGLYYAYARRRGV